MDTTSTSTAEDHQRRSLLVKFSTYIELPNNILPTKKELYSPKLPNLKTRLRIETNTTYIILL